jgi:hypothetical protein
VAVGQSFGDHYSSDYRSTGIAEWPKPSDPEFRYQYDYGLGLLFVGGPPDSAVDYEAAGMPTPKRLGGTGEITDADVAELDLPPSALTIESAVEGGLVRRKRDGKEGKIASVTREPPGRDGSFPRGVYVDWDDGSQRSFVMEKDLGELEAKPAETKPAETVKPPTPGTPSTETTAGMTEDGLVDYTKVKSLGSEPTDEEIRNASDDQLDKTQSENKGLARRMGNPRGPQAAQRQRRFEEAAHKAAAELERRMGELSDSALRERAKNGPNASWAKAELRRRKKANA